MGLMEKVKHVAGEMGDAAKKGASQLQTKVEQTQLRRKADDAAKRLGYLIYRQRTGAVTTDGDLDALVAEIKDAEEQLASAAAAAPSAEKAIDPVCGMSVDIATAIHSYEHEGTTYYFCSKTCLDTFAADPAEYAKTSTAASAPEVPPPTPSQAAEEATGE